MAYDMYPEAAAVTPHVSAAQTLLPCDGLYVGGAGNLEVIMKGGTTVIFAGVLAGTVLPIGVSRVLAANTTATSIVALESGGTYS
jgi:hypothetical protein